MEHHTLYSVLHIFWDLSNNLCWTSPISFVEPFPQPLLDLKIYYISKRNLKYNASQAIVTRLVTCLHVIFLELTVRRGLCPTEVKFSGPLATILASHAKFPLTEGVYVFKKIISNFIKAVQQRLLDFNETHTLQCPTWLVGPSLKTFVGPVLQPLRDLKSYIKAKLISKIMPIWPLSPD